MCHEGLRSAVQGSGRKAQARVPAAAQLQEVPRPRRSVCSAVCRKPSDVSRTEKQLHFDESDCGEDGAAPEEEPVGVDHSSQARGRPQLPGQAQSLAPDGTCLGTKCCWVSPWGRLRGQSVALGLVAWHLSAPGGPECRLTWGACGATPGSMAEAAAAPLREPGQGLGPSCHPPRPR